MKILVSEGLKLYQPWMQPFPDFRQRHFRIFQGGTQGLECKLESSVPRMFLGIEGLWPEVETVGLSKSVPTLGFG